MQNHTTFYVASGEGPREGQPWKCNAIKRIIWIAKYTRDDGMLVSLLAPIPDGVYGNQFPIQELVLFSRYMGETLFPISSWPMTVNICIVNNDRVIETGRAEGNDLTHVDIGFMGDLDQVNERRYKDRYEDRWVPEADKKKLRRG